MLQAGMHAWVARLWVGATGENGSHRAGCRGLGHQSRPVRAVSGDRVVCPVMGLLAESLLSPHLTVVQHVTGYAFMAAVESHVSLKLEAYAPQV